MQARSVAAQIVGSFLLLFVCNDQPEASMRRTIAYRGFEIHVELTPSADDTFNVTFQIKGGTNLKVLGAQGGRIPLRNGPFTERWAYLVAEIAGQAAIDVLLGPVH
ncbi:hypothetical protein WQE_35555 [Paraburkholderia hospita]|uniref:Uncharacterized protein n=2 Tax=Paraburkholderia hospita TaxID=169430 RepID=A0ABN0FC56_9BURK|nr:hypothetical protein WQE_35555 [Paraburkholderia hospita]